MLTNTQCIKCDVPAHCGNERHGGIAHERGQITVTQNLVDNVAYLLRLHENIAYLFGQPEADLPGGCVATDTLVLVLGYSCSLGADDEFGTSHHDYQRTHGSHTPHGYTNIRKTEQSKI